MPLLPEYIPENGRELVRLEHQIHLLGPLQNEFLRFAGFGDARKIAFDVSGKYRNARACQTLGKHLQGYEQYHRLPDGMGSGDEWDGIAIQRYESEDAFAAFLNDPAYAEKVAADEQEFMDVGRVVWFIAQPPEVFV